MAKRKYDLIGIDGNAFSIIGYVATAMKECGFPWKEIVDYKLDATSADYIHLLCVSIDIVDKCNGVRK